MDDYKIKSCPTYHPVVGLNLGSAILDISILVKLLSKTKILFLCHNIVKHESKRMGSTSVKSSIWKKSIRSILPKLLLGSISG